MKTTKTKTKIDLLREKYPDEILYSNSPEAAEFGAGETPVCPHCGKQTPFIGYISGESVCWLRNTMLSCECEAAAQEAAAAMAKEKEAKRREKVKELQEYAGLAARDMTRTFDSFIETPENRKALKVARLYSKRVIDGTILQLPQNSLYIFGAYGTGKTHLAAAIANEVISNGKSVVYTRFGELCRDVKRAFDSKAKEGEEHILRKYKTCYLLILDDLGKERITDWSLALLFELIDSRYRDMKPTVITANYSVEQTVDKLTANGADACTAGAIEDRCQEVYFQTFIDGQSWRRAGRN